MEAEQFNQIMSKLSLIMGLQTGVSLLILLCFVLALRHTTQGLKLIGDIVLEAFERIFRRLR